MTSSTEDLRRLVSVAVRDAVAEIVSTSVRETLASGPVATATKLSKGSPPSSPSGAVVTSGVDVAGRSRVEVVRMSDDDDLNAFARHLLALYENPKNRQDLRAGRIQFRCAPGPSRDGAQQRSRRIERGAVTERHIKAAAEAGERVILAPRAVLTPLGREKARSLGVYIEKER
jgi:hypothetical protein